MSQTPAQPPVTKKKMRFATKVKIVAGLLFFALVLILVLLNMRENATIHLLFDRFEAPTAVVLAVTAAVSFALGFVTHTLRARK